MSSPPYPSRSVAAPFPRPRPYRVAITAVLCCAISAIVWLIVYQGVQAVDARLARKEAKTIAAEWDQQLDKMVHSARAVSAKLHSGEIRTKAEFEQEAQKLIKDGYEAIEWHPRVTSEERESFEQQLSEQTGVNVEIRVRQLDGIVRRLEGHKKQAKTFYPSQFVVPSNRAAWAIGLCRRKLDGPRSSINAQDIVVSARRPFYPGHADQLAVFLGAHEVAHPGYLLATLPANLLGVETLDEDRRTIARIVSMKSSSGARTTVAAHPLLEDGKPMTDLVAHDDWSLGNQTWRAEFARNPHHHEAWAFLPWLALAAGPIWWCQRTRRKWRLSAHELARLNEGLRDEVQSQVHTQRALKNLLEFREQERQSIANEIHDGFVQEAFGAQMFLESLSARAAENLDATARSHLQSTLRQLDRCIHEARQLVSNLQPSVIDQLGFIPAVQNLVHTTAERFGLKVVFEHSENFPEVHINTQRALYRIVQESLANIRKHSGAEEAAIELSHDTECVYLTISDRGTGFDQLSANDSSFGLRGIRDRASHLNGTARIQSVPGQGTQVHVEVPYRLAAETLASGQ